MQLYENERCDEVNSSLSLIQKTDGLLFGTDALLLAAYPDARYSRGIELGGGTGIVSMLLLSRGKLGTVECVEAQEEYFELIKRNTELNGLQGKLIPVLADIREYAPRAEFDVAFSNPPYMKLDSGKRNTSDKKNIARHEVKGDVRDFANAARRYLKFGGSFVVVYRPDRLIDLISALREESLEPKRASLVFADKDSQPSMILIEAKKGGKSGLKFTKPFIIYRDKEHKEYTDDMNFVMENGSFPEEFTQVNRKAKRTHCE
jgi:tRNA1Val (adenine37-N6)-methyltransferase